MPSAIETKNPLVYVGGNELTREQLTGLLEIRVEMEMRLPGRVTLRFQDPDGSLAKSGNFTLGTKLSVKVPGGSPIIDAEITGLGYEASTGAEAKERFSGRTSAVNEFVVTAYDYGHRLTRTSTVKGLTQVTASQIAQQVAAAAGLTPEVDSTSLVYPTVAQLHRDFDLLNALADREGFDWWVSAGNTLHFTGAAGSSATSLSLGTEQLESFSVQATALHADKVSVRGWDPAQQQAIVSECTVQSSTALPQGVTLLNGFDKAGSAVGGDGVAISALLSPVSSSEGTDIAKGIADRIAAASVTARGQGEGNASIVVGGKVTVDGAGPIDGTYVVTKVEHIVRPASYKTRFVAGDRTPTSLADTISVGEQPRFPAARHGLVIGKVTNLGSDKPGMLKVKYPGLDESLESGWARFLAIGAGGSNGRGLVLLPEVNDEVLVAFEDGDVHRPVVLGGLYSDVNPVGTWDVDNGKGMSRRFISRQGHLIEIKDGETDDAKYVKIDVAGGKGHTTVQVAGDKVEVSSPSGVPITLKTGGNNTVELKGDGAISMSGTDITIKGTAKVSIGAPTIEVKADAELKLEGGAQAALKGGAKLDLSGGAEVAVQAAIVKLN